MSLIQKQPSETAERLASMGFRVFPIAAGTKDRPLVKWKEEAAADRLAVWQWSLEHGLRTNYGIALDEMEDGTRPMVIDLDAHGAGAQELSDFWKDRMGGGMPVDETMTCRTPHGGMHFYYDIKDIDARLGEDDEMIGELKWNLPANDFDAYMRSGFEAFMGNAVDVLATTGNGPSIAVDLRMPGKGYVVAPGSLVEFREYALIGADRVAPLPLRLAVALVIGKVRGKAARDARRAEEQRRRANVRVVDFSAEVSSDGTSVDLPAVQHERFECPEIIGQGERNSMLYRYARSLCRKVSVDELLILVDAKNRTACRPPLSDGEARDIALHAATQPDSAEFLAYQKVREGRRCVRVGRA